MGIGCGSAWCDIGPAGFTPSKPHAKNTLTPVARVLAVKGWYDEQRLAFPAKTVGGVTTPLSVGNVVGTFVPAPDLGAESGDAQYSGFAHNWKFVASAAIPNSPVYLDKLNLAQSSLPRTTDNVYLCYGRASSCKVPAPVPTCSADSLGNSWWTRIISRPEEPVAVGTGPTPAGAPAATTRDFCALRRGHEDMPNFHIPGIVRWRWALHDETMWIRCLEGCCEVEVGKS
jgi:hypothetical protein